MPTGLFTTSALRFRGSALRLAILATLALTGRTVTVAQQPPCHATTADELFACYGGEAAFGAHAAAAVRTFLDAEDAVYAGDYAAAAGLLDSLYARYPVGDSRWWSTLRAPGGANVGSPAGYYGLRMLEDIVAHHRDSAAPPLADARTVRMTVVLVGCTEGVQPRTVRELETGTGVQVASTLEPALRADDYRIVRQSYRLFGAYLHAITGGALRLEVRFVERPDLCLRGYVRTGRPWWASIDYPEALAGLPDSVHAATDFWWVLYPSHVPDGPEFGDEPFITGGMGADAKGGPVFIIDDTWLTEAPRHLGSGAYTDVERRMYLPQWLLHEFYHHLFRIYPEYALEPTSHSWFDRATWPADFEGQFEADYYTEALRKRLRDACEPLARRLTTRRVAADTAALGALTLDDFLGRYERDEIQNDWHAGAIVRDAGRYYWRNDAGVAWEVTDAIAAGHLATDATAPYPNEPFVAVLHRERDGGALPGVTGLQYQGGLHRKVTGMLGDRLPYAAAVGSYTRVPRTGRDSLGELVKRRGGYAWVNVAGDTAAVTPLDGEAAYQRAPGGPDPGGRMEVVLAADTCSARVLGFRYADAYHWLPRSGLHRSGPVVSAPLGELRLDTAFGSATVRLAGVFAHPDGARLWRFAASSVPGALEVVVDGDDLRLAGGLPGRYEVYVMAFDGDRGLAVDTLVVQVGAAVSADRSVLQPRALALAPNPARGEVTVTGLRAGDRVEVVSPTGQRWVSATAQGALLRLDAAGWPEGAFVVNVRDAAGVLVGAVRGWRG